LRTALLSRSCFRFSLVVFPEVTCDKTCEREKAPLPSDFASKMWAAPMGLAEAKKRENKNPLFPCLGAEFLEFTPTSCHWLVLVSSPTRKRFIIIITSARTLTMALSLFGRLSLRTSMARLSTRSYTEAAAAAVVRPIPELFAELESLSARIESGEAPTDELDQFTQQLIDAASHVTSQSDLLSNKSVSQLVADNKNVDVSDLVGKFVLCVCVCVYNV
jgi:hypothetical protein